MRWRTKLMERVPATPDHCADDLEARNVDFGRFCLLKGGSDLRAQRETKQMLTDSEFFGLRPTSSYVLVIGLGNLALCVSRD